MKSQNQYMHGGEIFTEIQSVQKLLAEVIRQAVEDYRHMEIKGIVMRGKVVSGQYERHITDWAAIKPDRFKSRRHAIGRGMSGGESEAREIVEFFTRGHMDDLIDVACLPVNANSIRERLGIS